MMPGNYNYPQIFVVFVNLLLRGLRKDSSCTNKGYF